MFYLFVLLVVLSAWFFIYRWIQAKVNRPDQPISISQHKLKNTKKIKRRPLGAIDHIYVLNLEKNKQKRKRIAVDIKNKLGYELTEDNFFPAFYGKNVVNSVSSLIKEGILDPFNRYSFFHKLLYQDRLKNPGQLGHYISFYQIFTNAIANKLEYFMILEDDAVVDPSLRGYLSSLLKIMQDNNFAYISLGQANYFYQQNKRLIQKKSSLYHLGSYNFYSVDQSRGLFRQTHAMIFKTELIKSHIEKYFPMVWPTDVALGYWAKGCFTSSVKKVDLIRSPDRVKLPGLFCAPALAKQSDLDSSDIDHWLDMDLKKITRVKP